MIGLLIIGAGTLVLELICWACGIDTSARFLAFATILNSLAWLAFNRLCTNWRTQTKVLCFTAVTLWAQGCFLPVRPEYPSPRGCKHQHRRIGGTAGNCAEGRVCTGNTVASRLVMVFDSGLRLVLHGNRGKEGCHNTYTACGLDLDWLPSCGSPQRADCHLLASSLCRPFLLQKCLRADTGGLHDCRNRIV